MGHSGPRALACWWKPRRAGRRDRAAARPDCRARGRQGDLARAEKILAKAPAAVARDSPQAARLMGALRLEQGNARGALESLAAARALAPADTAVYRDMAQAYYALGAPAEAAEVWRGAVAAVPGSGASEAFLNVAVLAREAGRHGWAEAERAYRAAMRLDDGVPLGAVSAGPAPLEPFLRAPRCLTLYACSALRPRPRFLNRAEPAHGAPRQGRRARATRTGISCSTRVAWWRRRGRTARRCGATGRTRMRPTTSATPCGSSGVPLPRARRSRRPSTATRAPQCCCSTRGRRGPAPGAPRPTPAPKAQRPTPKAPGPAPLSPGPGRVADRLRPG